MIGATQRKLVDGLLNTGPARWALTVNQPARPYIHEVMVTYLREQVVFMNTHGGKAVDAVIIGPAAKMNVWWTAGWKHAHLSVVKFMNEPMPEDIHIGVAIFDEQQEYSPKYLAKLDEFFETQAESALVFLPEKPPVELGRVLAKHRFVNCVIN